MNYTRIFDVDILNHALRANELHVNLRWYLRNVVIMRRYETLGVTYGAILVCAVLFSLCLAGWVLVAEAAPRWPWTIDFADRTKVRACLQYF